MQLHCETSLISSSTSNFPFSVNPISYSSSNRISFPFSYSFSTLKARATLNNGGFTKPISEMTFYDLLGIPQNVSLIEIKQAYKQLARKYHPDVSPPDLVDEYTHRFIRVQEAYEVLSDPRTRAIYDRDMARGLHLAFSARKNFDLQEVEDKSDWRGRWQSQLSGLKKRSMYKDANQNSWGARMRRQRNELSES
ncbi:chaperone protein dnaJ 20, chloroplastic isoform X1 [Beta vulgaris subsp. vulgaris]|uniref:chaperone protein dnaJ 20, chloroplastic isoform X1 n=1 Tax=Beta vulgaris subsp. vulgaris TaxID=3555 RepID=UPI0020370FC3|nr:chaperone protein dnaJ 20, chloroplastic isoform X1 [Beta vulgaris subsp. vulgaris]